MPWFTAPTTERAKHTQGAQHELGIGHEQRAHGLGTLAVAQ